MAKESKRLVEARAQAFREWVAACERYARHLDGRYRNSPAIYTARCEAVDAEGFAWKFAVTLGEGRGPDRIPAYCEACLAKEVEMYGIISNLAGELHTSAVKAAGCPHAADYPQSGGQEPGKDGKAPTLPGDAAAGRVSPTPAPAFPMPQRGKGAKRKGKE